MNRRITTTTLVFLSFAATLSRAQSTRPAASADDSIFYGVPSESSIRDTLARVLAYLDHAMPTRVIDRKTHHEITDLTKPVAAAISDRGDHDAFDPISYPSGVTYAGMLAAADATGDRRFADFTARHLAYIHDHLDYFQVQADQFGAATSGFHMVYAPRALDDCGAMCAALIKARRQSIGPDLKDVVDRWIDYVHTKQFRLDDGTLARHRPQPESIWADDLYMSVPALAQMGKLTGDAQYYDDAAKQVLQIAGYLFNKDRGLYMHGRNMNQPDNPEFYWGRANGWAMMSTVELLGVLPENHPRRPELLALLRAHIKGVSTLQGGDGLWHQMLDKESTFPETSASAMFVFAIARAINRDWISPVSYGAVAQAGWNALAAQVDSEGHVNGTCIATTFASDNVYYYHRQTSPYAPHGYGPVLLAGAEMIHLLHNPNIEIKNGMHYIPTTTRPTAAD